MPQQALHLVGGTVGYSPGLQFIDGGSNNDIDIDADGVMGESTIICVDLSEALGYRLGKQIPMTANFRVNYLRFGLRNKNDTNDNDGPNYFVGDWEFYSPTKHRVDAVQAWRGLEKRMEEDEVDSGLLGSTPQDQYTGFRFGWSSNTNITHATGGAPAELATGYALAQMLSVYNSALDGDGVPTRTRAIWDRKVGRSSHIGTHAVANNGDGQIGSSTFADIKDGIFTAPSGHCLEVLGGLMVLNITHSSPNTPQIFDDDFEVYLDIGVSGWSSW